MKKIKAAVALVLAPRLENEKTTFRFTRPTSLIIGFIFTVIALVMPAVSFAATLNNDPQDFATLRVINYTVNSACVTCWSSSATANAGDIVSFAIYYHNVGPETATNVRVRLSPQATTAGNTHTFTATVSADNAPAVSGTVVVTTSSAQTISFLSNGVIWRANQTVYGSSPLPQGQLASDLFNGVGINLGNVASGWSTQGSLIARFQASPTGGSGTSASAPYVSTNSATSVSQNSATLNGYVTPNGANTSAWFEWGTTQSLGNTTSNINYGTSATSFNNSLFNLSANTTYYYRAAAQNSQGTQYGSILSFTTSGQTASQPYVSTNSATSVSQNSATLNGYVTPNGANTSAWFEWGTSYSLGNTTSYNSYGSGSTSFNAPLYNLNPNTTYYYRAVAQSSYGTQYGSTLSFTTSGQTYTYTAPAYVGSAPTANTLLATELTGTTAKLNGLVITSESVTSNAWYEWGATSSLGSRTQTINVGALPVVKHSDFITGLTVGQTYYYRIVAENTYGKTYGVVNSFVSQANNYVAAPVAASNNVAPKPVVLKPTTTVVTQGSSVQSLVSLSLDGGAEMIGVGEKRTYRVTWKNESNQDLNNVVIRVTFPSSMNIDSATKGAYSGKDNAVIIDLKTLGAKDGGDAFIFASASRGVKSGELLVVTANMVYTEKNGVQGDAIAYATHTVEVAQNALGASVFGAGEFVPTTLFEWILLLILVLSLVLLGNHLYGRFSGSSH